MKSRDRGSGPITVFLMIGVMALLLAAVVTGVLSAASTERSGAEHAADAAALAGAQGVVDNLSSALVLGFEDPDDIVGLLGGGVCLQTGRIQATQLAAANHASLTSYCYNVFADEVTTSVIMNGSNVDSRATARAEASTTFDAPSCHLDPSFDPPTPSPSPSPDPDDDPDDEDDQPTISAPPTPIETWVDCGSGHLDVKFDVDDLRFHFTDLAGAVADLKPRLTG